MTVIDYPDYPRPALRDSLLRAGGLLVLVVIIAWAWAGSEFQITKLLVGFPRLVDFFGRMIPPDMSVAETVVTATIETIQIALFGTFLSVIASFFLGVLAAVNLAPRWIHQPAKLFLSVRP